MRMFAEILTVDWTFEDWSEFYLKKAKEDKQ